MDLELRLKYPPVPSHASDLAELAVASSRSISRVELDYEPESLILLDQIVASFAEEVSPSQFASTLFCFGCYLGEVLKRTAGGTWVESASTPIQDYTRWPMVLSMPDGSYWNPIGKVFKRFELGEGENLFHFFQAVAGTSDETLL